MSVPPKAQLAYTQSKKPSIKIDNSTHESNEVHVESTTNAIKGVNAKLEAMKSKSTTNEG